MTPLPRVLSSTKEKCGAIRVRVPRGVRRRAARFAIALAAGLAAGSGARADEVDDYIAAQMSRQHIPGLSLAVLKEGRPVIMKGYGLANLEVAAPATAGTVYAIGSISKQFIAAAIVRLSEDGKVGLDDSVRKFLEDAPESWQPITIRHLLTHTSGLVRETPGLQLKSQSDIDVIRAGYAAPLAFAPGEKWQYSNLGYFVLAEIIARATQAPWPRYLEERIFQALGMTATRTTTLEEIIPGRATGYQWMDRGNYHNAQLIPGVRPSGAFLSSVADLAKWDAALYSDEVFSPAQRELMWTPVKLNDGSERPYGFGWEIGKLGQHRQLKHAGTMLGFRSQILRFPDDRLTIVVLANATQAVPEKIALGVASRYLPDLSPARATRTATTLSVATLDAYTGNYEIPGNRVLTVARRDDKLTVAMALAMPGLGPDVAALVQGVSMDIAVLTPETDTRFFDEDDPRSTYVFSRDAQGQTQFAVEDPNGKAGAPAVRRSAPAENRASTPAKSS